MRVPSTGMPLARVHGHMHFIRLLRRAVTGAEVPVLACWTSPRLQRRRIVVILFLLSSLRDSLSRSLFLFWGVTLIVWSNKGTTTTKRHLSVRLL